jgi:hypothetical protein
VRLKGVSAEPAEVPAALAGDISVDDLRQWLTDTLVNGGIKVTARAEKVKSAGAAPAPDSDIAWLRWCDSFYGEVDVSLATVRADDGSVSISYELDVARAGIIMPGWMQRVAVDTVGGVLRLGAARNVREDVRQAVTTAAAQIVSHYQYANRPSDTSAASDGR